jgi:hypothetical protein
VKVKEKLLSAHNATVNKIPCQNWCWSNASYGPWLVTVKQYYRVSDNTNKTMIYIYIEQLMLVEEKFRKISKIRGKTS